MSDAPVLVVGGGIGGLAAAVALRRAGVEVRVLERTEELHEVGAVLGLACNAMRALGELGLGEQVAAIGTELHTFEHRTASGRTIARWPTGRVAQRLGEPIMAASRPALLHALASAVPAPDLRLGAECIGLTPGASEATVELADGAQVRGALVIGADGARSVVRGSMGGARLRYAGYTEWRAIASMPAPAPGVQMQAYGPGLVFGTVPLGSDHVGWFGRWVTTQGGQDAPGTAKARLLELFGDWHAPVPEAIQASEEEQIARADIFDLPAHRHWGEGRVSLLGDAAHATQPTLGQGAALALEDAAVLARCIRALGTTPEALRDYERRRIGRTASVVATSARQAAINRWRRPLACRVREGMIATLPAPLALRQFERVVRFDG